MKRLAVALFSLALLAAPVAVKAQSPGSTHRVGIIHHSDVYHVVVDGLRQGLRELGLEEGKGFVLDIRETKGYLLAGPRQAEGPKSEVASGLSR